MEKFKEWLIQEKGFSKKGSNDVISRLKRVYSILSISEISKKSINSLENNSEFKTLSMSVRSQLRRAIKLYDEYSS